MKLSNDTAAICGLFCGTCPSYPASCAGCLSQRVAAECAGCPNGFRNCAQSHNVIRCSDCADFPCQRLRAFSKKHIVNGICHHEQVIQNLEYIRKNGVSAFIKQQAEQNTCKECGTLIHWFHTKCPRCEK